MKEAIIRITLASIVLFSFQAYILKAQESPFPRPEERLHLKIGEHVIKPGKFANCAADFGIILVPENRNKPDSKTIQLAFIRIHALEGHTAEPIFLLNGGPGKSNIRGVLPSVFFKHNDLVIVGYRGIDSSVKLECKEVSKAFTTDNPLSPESLARIRKIIRKSYDRFTEEGVDINGYTVLKIRISFLGCGKSLTNSLNLPLLSAKITVSHSKRQGQRLKKRNKSTEISQIPVPIKKQTPKKIK